MYCRNLAESSLQASANAKQTGVAWVFFTDTSGNARCERASGMTGTAHVRCIRQWSGVEVVVVQPDDADMLERGRLRSEGPSS